MNCFGYSFFEILHRLLINRAYHGHHGSIQAHVSSMMILKKDFVTEHGTEWSNRMILVLAFMIRMLLNLMLLNATPDNVSIISVIVN